MVKKAVFNTRRPFILASGSPRRHDFLSDLGLKFIVKAADVDESVLSGETPETFVRRLALEKAWAVAKEHSDCFVLGADTVVVRDGSILGKPKNRREAEEILLSLVGRWHEVWTGFALCCQGPYVEKVGAVVTRVRFANVAPDLINAYVASGDGDDKAGAYGMQSGGAFLVDEIAGSYSNVIGLPVSEVVAMLLEFGVVEAFGFATVCEV